MEACDAQAVSDLFTEDAAFQRGPFDQKLRGRPVIREACAEALEGRDKLSFGYEVLTASNRGGIARWWLTADESQFEGISKLVFDETGLCKDLKAWWNAAP